MNQKCTREAPQIFGFDQYRGFLREIIQYRKECDQVASVQVLSRQMGASASYLKLVLAGKRNLSLEHAARLALVLGLDSVSRSFLFNLILREGAASPAVRRHFDLQLSDLRKSAPRYHANRRLLSIFSNSLTWEIFSLVGVEGFNPDARWIAQHLARRRVSEMQIRDCLDFLVEIGALAREGDRLVAKDVVLKDGQDLRPIYALALRRAIEHLESRDVDPSAAFDSFCLILSENDYRNIQEIMRDTKERILAVASRKGSKSRIAYFNMNLFCASK